MPMYQGRTQSRLILGVGNKGQVLLDGERAHRRCNFEEEGMWTSGRQSKSGNM